MLCEEKVTDTRFDRLSTLFRHGRFDWDLFMTLYEEMDKETYFRIAVIVGITEGRFQRLLEIVQDARWRGLLAAAGSWLATALAKPVSDGQTLTTGEDPSLNRLLLALSIGPDPFALHPDFDDLFWMPKKWRSGS